MPAGQILGVLTPDSCDPCGVDGYVLLCILEALHQKDLHFIVFSSYNVLQNATFSAFSLVVHNTVRIPFYYNHVFLST